MAIKNKLFKISTLSIIMTIAVAFCYISDKVSNVNYEETANMGKQTEAKSELTENNVTIDNDVVEHYDEEVSKGVKAAALPTETPSQAALMGFEPIPGVEIPGIDYKQYIDYNIFNGISIVATNNYVNIRKGPGENYDVIGKIRPNGAVTVLENVEQGGIQWSKITSGGIEGYLRSEFLKHGNEALALVSSVGRLVVTSKCDALNVRQKPSLDAAVLYQVSKDEVLDIVSVSQEWVEVKVDIGNETAFINKSYVNISFRLHEAFKLSTLRVAKANNDNTGNVVIDTSAVSEVRYNMVSYAQKYIGYNYVYGGTTLTKKKGQGIDCSAFMQKIYAAYGYSIPRTSSAQASCGTSIKRSQLRPGDLVFYRRGGRIGHVAMYIGDNTIIHASNRRDGIKYSNMSYTSPAKYVRVIND